MEIFQNLSIVDIEGEIWLPIIGYETYYLVSNMGRVKGVDRIVNTYGGERRVKGKIVKSRKSDRRYIYAMLSKNGYTKNCQVHRLVAIVFIENPDKKPQVNHKWGIKHDNRLTELEWATASEDELHSYRVLGKRATAPMLGRLGADNPKSIRIECPTLGVYFESATEAARELGLSQGNVWNVLKGVRPHTKGYVFKYVK
jgi:hypothetical protein